MQDRRSHSQGRPPKGFWKACSRMRVTLPSGSWSALKLAGGGNKSGQAILPLLSPGNVMVELSDNSENLLERNDSLGAFASFWYLGGAPTSVGLTLSQTTDLADSLSRYTSTN